MKQSISGALRNPCYRPKPITSRDGGVEDPRLVRIGKYFMADARDNPNQTGVAHSDDLVHWTEALDRPVLPNRPVYRTGWAIFDAHDPTKLLARSEQPIFQPEKDWGVQSVVFVEGRVRTGGTWLFHYGGADN